MAETESDAFSEDIGTSGGGGAGVLEGAGMDASSGSDAGGISVTDIVLNAADYDDRNIVSGATPGSTEPDAKDATGVDPIIPLSPQWLFSKPNDSKPPLSTLDSPRTLGSSAHGGINDLVVNERRKVEGNNDTEKRRDWWRTMSTASDTGRRDRWREEEREGSIGGRRDRWKEAGDGAADSKRWPESPAVTKDAETRHVPTQERWSDSSSRDTNYEVRRDSKWSTRWGPEDKEREFQRGKRLDSEKEGGAIRDRQHTLSNSSRTENEADASTRDRDRIWRPHSIASRGKGEVPPLSSTPPKYALAGSGSGRGRGDGFAAGRGRGLMNGPPLSPIGASIVAKKSDANQAYRYPRGKLLDIYRVSSASLPIAKLPESVTEVPQLTQAEALEPLAFFIPDMEEEATLEGISKGVILSSGPAHLACRDANSSKVRDDGKPSHVKGSKDEASINCEEGVKLDFVVEIMGNGKMNPGLGERVLRQHDVGLKGVRKPNDASNEGQVSGLEVLKMENRERTKEATNLERSLCADVSGGLPHDGGNNFDEKVEVLDKYIAVGFAENLQPEDRKEVLETNVACTLPEDLSLYYTDPQGEVQGPFRVAEMISWLEAGYFSTDLPVRVADAPESTPFTPLGDIMPHLKSKVQVHFGVDALTRLEESEEKPLRPKFLQQGILDSTEQRVDRDPLLQHGFTPGGFFGMGEHLLNEDAQLSLISHEDLKRGEAVDKLFEPEESSFGGSRSIDLLERASPLQNRLPTLPCVEAEDAEASKISLFSQRWPGNDELMHLISGAPVSKQTNFPPVDSSASLSMSDHEKASFLRAAGTFPHPALSQGLDTFHLHQLQRLEKEQFERSLQQQQQPLLSHYLNPHQHSDGAPFLEQILNPSLSNSPNPNVLEHLSSLHPPPASQPRSQFHEGSVLDQLVRFQHQHQHQHQHQQQQQQQHQQQQQLQRQRQQQQHQQLHLSPENIFERLVRQQPYSMPTGLHGHLNKLQDKSRLDIQDQYLEQVLQRHAEEVSFENFIRRQQEQQQQHARQHAYLLQRQRSNLEEQRIRGVWEVDESGHFVRTQVPNQILAHEALQYQQHQELHRQSSFPPLRHSQVQLQAEFQGLQGFEHSQRQQPKLDMRIPPDLQAGVNFPGLRRSHSKVDSDFFIDSHGPNMRLEGQNNFPALDSFNLELDALRNKARIEEAVARRGWNTGHYDADPQLNEMLLQLEGAPMLDQHFRNNQLPGQSWQHDLHSANNNLSKASSLQARTGHPSPMEKYDNGGNPHAMGDDFFRLLASSSSLSGQVASSPPVSQRKQHSAQNLWSEEHINNLGLRPQQSPASLKAPWDFGASSIGVHEAVHQQNMDYCTSLDVMGSASNGPTHILDAGFDGWRGAITDRHFTRGKMGNGLPGAIAEHLSFEDKHEPTEGVSFATHGSDIVGVVDSLHSGVGNDSSTSLSQAVSEVSSEGDLIEPRESKKTMNRTPKDANKQIKAMKSLKELKDFGQDEQQELHGMEVTMHANMVKSSFPAPTGNSVPLWQRPPSGPQSHVFSQAKGLNPSLSPMVKSKIGVYEDDDEFFWDYNSLEMPPRSGRLDHLADQRLLQNNVASDFPSLAGFSVPTNTKAFLPTSKQPEDAKAFRQWCKLQVKSLTGNDDMRLLDFCMTLPSVLEAETYLSKYLGSSPAINTFKEEFLRKRELILPEVVHAVLPISEGGIADDRSSFNMCNEREDAKEKKALELEEEAGLETGSQITAGRSGKKKGKKGKKVVDPSLLGFNVASNRMFMGEIQHVDD